jgi:hypothetical protein
MLSALQIKADDLLQIATLYWLEIANLIIENTARVFNIGNLT